MTVITHIATFLIIWWLVLFTTLPIGVRPPHEAGEEREPGTPASAPVKPRMVMKLVLTTAITTVLWGLVWAADTYNWVNLKG